MLTIISEVLDLIGVDWHGFTPIVGSALGTELVEGGVPKEDKVEPSGGPKEAQTLPTLLLCLSGDCLFCLTWRLEGC